MTQRLYPNSDKSTGSWTKSGGASFFSNIDEDPTSNDGDSTYVETTGSEDILKVGLSSGSKASELTGHVIRFAYTPNPISAFDSTTVVELRISDTLIATVSDSQRTAEFLSQHGYEITIEYELTPDEAGTLTSLSTLELWIYVVEPLTLATLRVTAADFLIPDAQIVKDIVSGYI